MGVGGGGLWELLKPLARCEDVDFLRDKKVAVDLSYWIVQHETALRGSARNPHLRLTFFRTINLFSKFGAFPVFVVDGDPSPMKTKARVERFFRMSGIDSSELPKADGTAVARNGRFTKCVRECVELLELLGMPVLKARCEAEALCAQLNSDGHVDACVTADSDAFLFGAKCVIKGIKPNCKGSFIECYHMSDIEAILGLKRKQLIAVALLVGNDYDLNGVQGIGFSNAVRFVQLFHEDEILNRLREVGKEDPKLLLNGLKNVPCTDAEDTDIILAKRRPSHCSYCGHPGSKDAHAKLACVYCNLNCDEGCTQKSVGFKCECVICCELIRSKNDKKEANWQHKVCKLIEAEKNFPNQEILEMFLSNNHGYFCEDDGPALTWRRPEIGLLIDFLSYYQSWKPSYIRERMLPMLSTIFLREMSSNHLDDLLLCDQYKFDSVQRVKIRKGVQSYVVKWKRALPQNTRELNDRQKQITKTSEVCDLLDDGSSTPQTDFDSGNGESSDQVKELVGTTEAGNLLDDDSDVPNFIAGDGFFYITTDENMELVKSAFPEKVDSFLKEQEEKRSKSRLRKSPADPGTTQCSITQFFRSTKRRSSATPEQVNAYPPSSPAALGSKQQADSPSKRLSKSARKKLLFD